MSWQPELAKRAWVKSGLRKDVVADFCGTTVEMFNHYLAGRKKPGKTFVVSFSFAVNTPAEKLDPQVVKMDRLGMVRSAAG